MASRKKEFYSNKDLRHFFDCQTQSWGQGMVSHCQYPPGCIHRYQLRARLGMPWTSPFPAKSVGSNMASIADYQVVIFIMAWKSSLEDYKEKVNITLDNVCMVNLDFHT